MIINNVRKHKVDAIVVVFAADAAGWDDAGGDDDDGRTSGQKRGHRVLRLRNL